jgi:DnaK suppressor protein
MSDSFHDDMREKLYKLRAELELAAGSGIESSQVVELDQARVGRLSRMDALQAQAMSQAADRRRESTLRGIEAALVRIDNDSFGDCQDCDEPIHRKRLEFDPTATLCIECANKAEQ